LRNGYKFIDRPTALKILNQTAEQGVAPAQYALGHSYMQTTDDQRKDLTLARYWLEKAAAQGMREAAADLATLE
jgi:TPR repeat protein